MEHWKEDKKTETNEVMFALQHSAKHKIASNYGKSYYPSDYSPNAGWADYYGNEDFFKAYPNDDRKEWNYMTEWKIKSGEIIPIIVVYLVCQKYIIEGVVAGAVKG